MNSHNMLYPKEKREADRKTSKLYYACRTCGNVQAPPSAKVYTNEIKVEAG
jgi:DNA-directed RNA polymerase subunit M/transcription elongation factor TFIIS